MTTAELRIDAAGPADVQDIAAIYNSTLPPAPAGIAIPGMPRRMGLEEAQGWLRLHELSHRPLWVARSAGQAIAWLSHLGYFDRPGCEATAELAVYVARGWQGCGIGRQLVERAVAHALDGGYERLLAQIWSDNHASLALFSKAGFLPWGRLPGAVRIGARRCDMVILGMELRRDGAA
ncbi:GNAT family N-acetyltransferase [Aquabacterium sp. A7-Y]|uniref:GNAT family N-acetyltransferase n=1 Tax=Aquabacterium sp. A7-Y TaxID=1349605 RepID=UPI00223D8C80|nr:GNAT family N-acetyltransferase [Aquabacterium sp. A7-Y]MCW7540803.1 GNAT family N-acetyltransferase [Aquabacterium sp. A7-Y]